MEVLFWPLEETVHNAHTHTRTTIDLHKSRISETCLGHTPVLCARITKSMYHAQCPRGPLWTHQSPCTRPLPSPKRCTGPGSS